MEPKKEVDKTPVDSEAAQTPMEKWASEGKDYSPPEPTDEMLTLENLEIVCVS
jgi:hypothetical protein